MDRRLPGFLLVVLVVVGGLPVAVQPVAGDPSECQSLSEYASQQEYRDCLVENTSKQEIMQFVQQDKSELTQKQIDAVHAAYPYHAEEYGFNQSEQRQITMWMTGVDFEVGENGNSSNTSSDGNTSDGEGSEWSKARVLALVDDRISQHPSLDVEQLETWYQAHEEEFSSVEQRWIESWITWYKTGQKPFDGLHPDLLSDVGGGGEPRDSIRLNRTISAGSLEQGRRQVSQTVTVVGHEFYSSNETVVMVVESEGRQTVVYTDSVASRETRQLQAQRITLKDGRNYLKLPAAVAEGTQQVTLKQGLEGAILISESPPLLKHESNVYIWYGGAGIGLGMSLMALMWYIRRERIYQRFRPAARLISGQVKTSGGFINRFTPGGDDDDPEDDEYEDNLRGLIRRYASIRSLASTAVKVVFIVYLLDAAGVVSVPSPPIGDPAKIILGLGVIGYTVVGPFLLKPILEAAYSVNLEKIQLLDVDGNVNGAFWAKKGTFRTDYEIDSHRDVPVRETNTGERCYLCREIDREEQQAKPAFAWQAEEVDEIEGLEEEHVRFIDEQKIAIDQILSDVGQAAYVIKDMAAAAYTGHKIRNNWPLIRASDAYRLAQDSAEGLEKALTGGTVDDVMEEQIEDYERRNQETEGRRGIDSQIDDVGDYDEYEGSDDPGQEGGDTEE